MKKKMLAYILLFINVVVGCILFSYIYYKKEPAIHNKVNSYRQSRHEKYVWSNLMDMRCDINSLPILQNKQEAWYMKYHIVAHGGGAIDGKINTNSKEAWVAAYERGVRLFDADINRTSDGYYVLRHSWDDNLEQTKQTITTTTTTTTTVDWVGYIRYVSEKQDMKYMDFLSTPIFRRYKSQTVGDMFAFMEHNTDVYIIADIKLYSEFNVVYSYLSEYCTKEDKSNLLDRIVISTANIEQIKAIRTVNPHAKLTYRVYEYPNNFSEAVKLCVENDIHVCMLAQKFAKPEVIKMFTDKGILVFVSLVNYESDYEYYQSIGVSGCLSDYLYEK